ncbi:transmembrane protein, putative, partial [Bodo saltans]
MSQPTSLSSWKENVKLSISLPTSLIITEGGGNDPQTRHPSLAPLASPIAVHQHRKAQRAPKHRVPLLACFMIQLLVVMGGFAGMCAMFIVQNRTQLDQNVDSIVRAKLHAGSVALRQPLIEHIYRAEQLKMHIISGGWQMTDKPNSSAFNYTAEFDYFPTMRMPILETNALRWTYQILDTGRYYPNIAIPTKVVHESGCGVDYCYYRIDDELWYSYYGQDAAAQGVLLSGVKSSDYKSFQSGNIPFNFSTIEYLVDDYVNSGLAPKEYYRYGSLWNKVYLYIDEIVVGSNLLASVVMCLEFSNITNRCINAVGADINMAYLTTLTSQLQTDESSVSVVDLRTMFMLATTYASPDNTNTSLSASNQTTPNNVTLNASAKEDFTWLAVDESFPRLRTSVAQYLESCPAFVFTN